MNKEIVTIAIRLLALFAIFWGLPSLAPAVSAYIYSANIDPLSKAAIHANLIATACTLILGFLLWLFSSFLSKLITTDLSSQWLAESGELSLERIQAAAVSVLGVAFLYFAIPNAMLISVSYFFPTINIYAYAVIKGSLRAEIPLRDVIKVASQLILGFWFFLGQGE